MLGEVRVQHIGLIDLFNDHRLLLCRNATGETLAHRDTNSLTNCRFDAEGNRYHQLVGGGVEQQHGGGVDAEEISQPVEKLGQERLNVDVSQRRVAHGLNPTQSLVSSSRRVDRFARHRHEGEHSPRSSETACDY